MAACGFFAEHIGGGHLSFTPFLYLPAIVWAFRRALAAPPADFRYAVLAAALLAATVLEGGTYPAPLMAVALAAETLSRLGARADRRALVRTRAGHLAAGGAAVGGASLAGAGVPARAPAPRADRRLLANRRGVRLLDDADARPRDGQPPLRLARVRRLRGVVPVALMLAGAALALFGRGDAARRRVRRIDLAVLIVLVWCALGGNRGASLFKLLHVLPVFDSLRVPARFLGPAMVAFGLLAAAALGAGRRWVAARWPAAATGATVGAAPDRAGRRRGRDADERVAPAAGDRSAAARRRGEHRLLPEPGGQLLAAPGLPRRGLRNGTVLRRAGLEGVALAVAGTQPADVRSATGGGDGDRRPPGRRTASNTMFN